MSSGGDVQKLEEEVKRLRDHLNAIQECDQRACALEFRKYVSGAKEPFHSNYDEANVWTMDSNKAGCCVIS